MSDQPDNQQEKLSLDQLFQMAREGEAIVFKQENVDDNVIMISQSAFNDLNQGQRNPDFTVTVGQRNPDFQETKFVGQRNPD